MKPVCPTCKRFYKPKKNGYYFLEGMPASNTTPPGTSHEAEWSPYKLWAGDLYECPGCLAQVVVGVPHRPIAEHYEFDFSRQLELYEPQVQVNDC